MRPSEPWLMAITPRSDSPSHVARGGLPVAHQWLVWLLRRQRSRHQRSWHCGAPACRTPGAGVPPRSRRGDSCRARASSGSRRVPQRLWCHPRPVPQPLVCTTGVRTARARAAIAVGRARGHCAATVVCPRHWCAAMVAVARALCACRWWFPRTDGATTVGATTGVVRQSPAALARSHRSAERQRGAALGPRPTSLGAS